MNRLIWVAALAALVAAAPAAKQAQSPREVFVDSRLQAALDEWRESIQAPGA